MKNQIKFLLLALLLFQFLPVGAQKPHKKYITVNVAPLTEDWTYKLGERADFEVSVLKSGQLLKDVKIRYEIGAERMQPEKTGEKVLAKGTTELKGMAMTAPGFLNCKIIVEYDGNTYINWARAGFEPDKIEAIATMPEDFNEFWNGAKEELAKVPMDAEMTLIPDLCTSEINVYHVNLQNIRMRGGWQGNSRFYGMLSVPKKEGKYPVILEVPGAGVRAYGRDGRASKGVIVFRVGIHGIPVNMTNEVYTDLSKGALADYYFYGLKDRNSFYYKRVYLGCIRAIDFIYSLDSFDGENLAVTGGSQGGALAIVTASLDERVKYLVSFFPALSDMTAYLEGRAGGWPHTFKDYDAKKHPNWVNTIGYYDVVNFARQLKIPGFYSWGFNDNVCPPTSIYAAYNSIKAPKEKFLALETAHWTFPEQGQKADEWLINKLFD